MRGHVGYQLQCVSTNHPFPYMGQQNLNSMFINLVNVAEVIRIIKLCRPKESMDYDDISMWVLSRIAPQVVILHWHIPE